MLYSMGVVAAKAVSQLCIWENFSLINRLFQPGLIKNYYIWPLTKNSTMKFFYFCFVKLGLSLLCKVNKTPYIMV